MKKTVTLLVLISMLFSTVFLFTGCGDSSVKEIKTADDIKGASVGVQTGTTGDTFVSDYEADGTKVMRYSKGADAIVGASGSLFGNLGESFKNTFITDNRWQQLLSGLLVTLEITLFAGIIGVIIGFVIALVRATHDIQLGKRKCRSFGDCVLKFFNVICNIYITVIRGTPVVVQLMIMYYIILASVRNGIFAAIIAFGMNSAAYVAEIVRSGIMAVDIGQTEASRSLGFNNRQTMTMVVLPQAIKNVLPALGNEIITLLKETSVAGYVALADITYIGNMIRSRTYEAFFPLITVALIYLVIVLVLSYILRRFERRLKKSER